MLQVKDFANRELLDLIDQSLKQTAKDVRAGRIPLDGRARLPLPEAGRESPGTDRKISDAAE
jgi:hypothetical protein